ncbi:anti-sigma factor [Vannielia litorea]|uniref:Regulator of SigK n=1 Tax=Vannielia litorea TaxID=1217970 RepID=A0A1N6GBZ6_9RHOB|nr:anti-sigma factor [Vannielia litorea]SIO05056.1 Anti-sigma-K factor RskA [Vannielia litorea]
MTEAAPYDEDDIALAGEYVLRLLGAEEVAAFEARLAAEPALRRLVTEWQEGLASLADEISEAPPAALWARIEAAAHGDTPLRSAVPFWGWLTGGLVAALLALAVFFVIPPGPVEPVQQARIAAEDGSLVVLAGLSAEGELHLVREAGGPRAGRVLELWLIAEGAPAPVSLGVLPEETDVRIPVPEALRARFAGGTLAISDEPPGGSPTGAPTGDVLAAAPIELL